MTSPKRFIRRHAKTLSIFVYALYINFPSYLFATEVHQLCNILTAGSPQGIVNGLRSYSANHQRPLEPTSLWHNAKLLLQDGNLHDLLESTPVWLRLDQMDPNSKVVVFVGSQRQEDPNSTHRTSYEGGQVATTSLIKYLVPTVTSAKPKFDEEAFQRDNAFVLNEHFHHSRLVHFLDKLRMPTFLIGQIIAIGSQFLPGDVLPYWIPALGGVAVSMLTLELRDRIGGREYISHIVDVIKSKFVDSNNEVLFVIAERPEEPFIERALVRLGFDKITPE
ncbi:MAG: hypothetical protein COT74_12315 [Bdellovibrionales bacterium CG10_big_fil_rev_8_21_14_0_10_45_34]|nr:MAG: hypothetical protein COT74_12315 [Bdellovibrionales bacterium CG10_big_fil_rev_8_21_14_0_10_45_34]